MHEQNNAIHLDMSDLDMSRLPEIINNLSFLIELNLDDPQLAELEDIISGLYQMTCPSTGHIHILRVPPEMESAEEAITWINHDLHPDRFAIQT
jgi:Leucine-rich repeat (LRR) protein